MLEQGVHCSRRIGELLVDDMVCGAAGVRQDGRKEYEGEAKLPQVSYICPVVKERKAL